MARRATHAFADVNAVIEIHKIRETVHPHPIDRLIGAIALANRLQVTHIVKQHRVAIHAGFCRWNAGGRRVLYPRVTIAAIDAIVADVMLVAELHGLLARLILVGQIWRTCGSQNSRERQSHQEKRRENTEAGDEVCAAVENLCHFNVCTLAASAPGGSRNLRDHQCPNRDVQARLVFDAIVSTKTFGNATAQAS